MKRIHPIEEEVEMAKARLKELLIELKKLNSIRSVLGKELGNPTLMEDTLLRRSRRPISPTNILSPMHSVTTTLRSWTQKGSLYPLQRATGSIVKEIPLTQIKKYFKRKKIMTLEQQIQQAEMHLKRLKAQLAQVDTLRTHLGDEYDVDQTHDKPRYKFIGETKDGHSLSLLYVSGDSYVELWIRGTAFLT